MKPLALIAVLFFVLTVPARAAEEPADLIIHSAKVVTLDAKSTIADAVAVRDGKIAAVGPSAELLKLKGEKTQVIDAGGRMVLPGLYDSHVHPAGAAVSEVGDPIPNLRS